MVTSDTLQRTYGDQAVQVADIELFLHNYTVSGILILSVLSYLGILIPIALFTSICLARTYISFSFFPVPIFLMVVIGDIMGCINN